MRVQRAARILFATFLKPIRPLPYVEYRVVRSSYEAGVGASAVVAGDTDPVKSAFATNEIYYSRQIAPPGTKSGSAAGCVANRMEPNGPK